VNSKASRKTKPKFTYAKAGVDRELRTQSKKALSLLERTYQFSRYGSIKRLPYGNIFPIGAELYLDLVIEGVGTKVLLAQLADKYDTIGIDGAAMAVNDTIRSGARPLAIADNIHAHVSDPTLVREWMQGIVRGADEAGCPVTGGEIGDVPDIIKGFVEAKSFDMVFASVGAVHKERIVHANNLRNGDVVIGLRSSGIHSNGVSLARRLLFRQWGGKHNPFDVPEGFDRELVYEVLEPTRIYVKPVMKLVDSNLIKAAVHITGDAYLKFDRLRQFNRGMGFEFSNFRPQRIFSLIQEVAAQLKKPVSDEEMFKTFNMGWGFAVIVDKESVEESIDLLERTGVEADEMGAVTGSGKVVVVRDGRKIALSRSKYAK
jgi:phosphoribosylformylglycinamidine cyclo-ligase